MSDPDISTLLGLLYTVSTQTRAVCFQTIKDHASSKKHIIATPQMLLRLCRLGYVRMEPEEGCETKYRITDDGRQILSLPLFERHTEFLQRKERHPEGRKCCVCGFSGPGLTRFKKNDYCPECLNSAYDPEFVYRGFSSLAWES